MKRGDVYWAELQPRSGSEQRGSRPVIVISNDGFNEIDSWRSIIVIPLTTSSKQRRRGATVVLLEQGEANLTTTSIALCHQITTLDRSKFTRKLGQLTADTLKRVEAGLKAAIDL